MKVNNIVSVLVTTLVTIIYFFIFCLSSTNGLGLGFSKDENVNILSLAIKPLILSIFTILGILSKIGYDNIKDADETNFKISDVFKKSINSKYAWLSIFICPIVIMGFYKNIEAINSYPLVAMLAYQNGFFFNSIINKSKVKPDGN